MTDRVVPLPEFNNELRNLRIEIDNEASITKGVEFSVYEVGDKLTVIVETDGDIVEHELGWEHTPDAVIETIVTTAVVTSWCTDGWRLITVINNQRQKGIRKETRRTTYIFTR